MAGTAASAKKTGQPKKQKTPSRSRVLQRRETMVSYLFLLPALFFFIGFVIVPMIMEFYGCQFCKSGGVFRWS